MIWETKAMLQDEIRKLNNNVTYLMFINKNLRRELEKAHRQLLNTEQFLAVLAAEQVPDTEP